MLEPFNILGCRGLVNLSIAALDCSSRLQLSTAALDCRFEREVARRGASGETSGEWRDQWGVARVSGKWGEPSGEWEVGRSLTTFEQVASLATCLRTPYSPLSSPHFPLTLATPHWSRHSPLVSPLPPGLATPPWSRHSPLVSPLAPAPFSRERAPPAPPPASRSAPGTASTTHNPARSDGRT